jgi:hypothetical protein
MFSQPIVFVIGAGASAELGLPTGAAMKAAIAGALNFNKQPNAMLIGDRAFYDMISNRFGGEAAKYHAAATELAVRIGEFDSIDEALHWFSAKEEVVRLGKAAIVREILRAEHASKVFNPTNPKMISGDVNYADTWLPHFLTMAMGSLTREQATEPFKNVTVINFNYDRTVEHFLFSRLQTNFGLSEDDARGAVASLDMIRPYGLVGPLPWQDASGVPFGAEITIQRDHEQLFQFASNVRTYTEQNLAEPLKLKIHRAMEVARLVVFLGFGFHQQNMALLRVGTAADWRRALATVVSIQSENYETMKIRIGSIIGANPRNVQLLPRYAYDLIQFMKPTLMANL